MKKFALAICLLFCGGSSLALAAEVTPLQLFFLVKQAFPEKTDVSVLITEEVYKSQEQKISRASAQMQLKVNIFIVAGPQDVGKALQKIQDEAVVIVFDGRSLVDQSTRLYVLSKCKDKQIALITTSPDYGESGALICLAPDESEGLKITLNLKKNINQKDRFNEELVQKLGVTEVVL